MNITYRSFSGFKECKIFAGSVGIINLRAPAGHPSNPESQGQGKPKIKCRKKSIRRLPTEKDKLHATKAKSSVKKYWRQDSNRKILEDRVPEKKRRGKFEAKRKLDFTLVTDNKIEGFSAPTAHPSKPESQGEEKPTIKCRNKSKRCLPTQKDHVPEKKRHAKFEVERKLDFTSASVNERESSPSLFKKMSTAKGHKKVKSSAKTRTCDDVHFVEKVKSSATSVPSKTHGTRKYSPASKPLKKRQRSVSPVEGQKMPLTLSPQKKRKEGENSTIAKPPERVLSMKFPRDTALPSASELKAKFARFGPIDTSGIRVSWAKSRCQVAFLNKSDAEKACEHAVGFKEMFGQTKVTYRLYHKVSTSNLLEGGISDANVGSDPQQEETPVTPPHAPVTSRSTFACRIERLAEEIYARYQEQADQNHNHVKVNQGSVDISEKMLHLLNECSQIVLELKRL